MNDVLRKAASVPPRVLSAVLYGLGGAINYAGVGLKWLKLKHIDYQSRPDDIFIVTYPRSGTTWLQMMLYQMTSDGELDMGHISDRSPWFERLAFNDRDLASLESPRLIKTHLPYARIVKGGGKYIYFCRDPRDVAVSYFHFYRSHLQGFQGDFDQFFDMMIRGRVQFGRWADHVAGWWNHRDEVDLLFLWYEDALKDPEGTIRIIAEFCDIPLDEASMPRILERTSFDYMKQHEAKFDHALELLAEAGLTNGGNFIRKGALGEGTEWLSTDHKARLDAALRARTGKTVEELMRAPTAGSDA